MVIKKLLWTEVQYTDTGQKLVLLEIAFLKKLRCLKIKPIDYKFINTHNKHTITELKSECLRIIIQLYRITE